MLVPMGEVINGVSSYVKSEVLPNLPSEGLKGFGIGFAAALAMNRIETIIRQLVQTPLVGMLGVVDEDDRVDIDALRAAALQAMPEEGLGIQLTAQHKITFSDEDVNKLYNLMKR